jgi:hypothetical protein
VRQVTTDRARWLAHYNFVDANGNRPNFADAFTPSSSPVSSRFVVLLGRFEPPGLPGRHPPPNLTIVMMIVV